MAPPVINIDFFVGGGTLSPAILAEILGGAEPDNLIDTALATAVGDTLAAAAILGGQITRTGPSAAFTDTTDTAAAMVAALGANIDVGQTFVLRYKNKTPYPATLAAGAGVTLPATVIVPPLTIGWYFGTVGGTQAAPTVTFKHTATGLLHAPNSISDPNEVALVTVGAGVVLASGMNAGLTARGGAQSFAAFTDTTDTAANIIAGVFGLSEIGASVRYRYINNTNAAATLATGDGANVVIAGASVAPPNSWVEYLLTRTAAGIVHLDAIGQGFFPKEGTFVANGATPVTVADARVTGDSQIDFTLKTVGGTVSPTQPNVLTITPGTGFTVGGVALDTSTYNYRIEG